MILRRRILVHSSIHGNIRFLCSSPTPISKVIITVIARQILWPIFHYQIPDNPKFKVWEKDSWEHYVAVNRAFAEVIVSQYKRGDAVWVNDYHLLLVPKMVRDMVPHAMIGLFLHIAFPSSEVFRCLPGIIS